MDTTTIILIVAILLPLLYTGYFYVTNNDPLGIGGIL